MSDLRIVSPLFPVANQTLPTSPKQLTMWKIEFAVAKALNRLWHSRLPKFASTIPGNSWGAEFQGMWYAIAIWSNPVARLLPQQTWLELRRLAIAPDAPRYTATWMLGRMVRLIRRERPDIVNLISYQDTEVHTRTIYRAAGWTPVMIEDPRSRPWNNVNRYRNKEQSMATKQRWELRLKGGTP